MSQEQDLLLNTTNTPDNSVSSTQSPADASSSELTAEEREQLAAKLIHGSVATPEQDLTKSRIKSYVLRTGRLTESQENSILRLFPIYGIEFPGLDSTLDVTTLFQKPQPVVVEIGFGMGTSLVQMAKENPELNYLGIEVHTPGVGNALKLIEAEGLTNIKVMRHDAFEVLQILPENSIAGLQLFFPDPWHKKAHHKRRIVNETFLALVTRALIPGGFIHMATD